MKYFLRYNLVSKTLVAWNNVKMLPKSKDEFWSDLMTLLIQATKKFSSVTGEDLAKREQDILSAFQAP